MSSSACFFTRCPGIHRYFYALPRDLFPSRSWDQGTDRAAAVADCHHEALQLRVETGHLSEEVTYPMGNNHGDRQRRWTVDEDGLAAAEFALSKRFDRINNNPRVVCGFPEGNLKQDNTGVDLPGGDVIASHCYSLLGFIRKTC